MDDWVSPAENLKTKGYEQDNGKRYVFFIITLLEAT